MYGPSSKHELTQVYWRPICCLECSGIPCAPNLDQSLLTSKSQPLSMTHSLEIDRLAALERSLCYSECLLSPQAPSEGPRNYCWNGSWPVTLLFYIQLMDMGVKDHWPTETPMACPTAHEVATHDSTAHKDIVRGWLCIQFFGQLFVQMCECKTQRKGQYSGMAQRLWVVERKGTVQKPCTRNYEERKEKWIKHEWLAKCY